MEDFTVSSYVDADEDTQTSEIDAMTGEEFSHRVRLVDGENGEEHDEEIEEIDQD